MQRFKLPRPRLKSTSERRVKIRQTLSSTTAPVTDATTLRPATKQRTSSLRAGIAVVFGRTAGAISRRLHLGGGTSIVGVVAQRLYPPIVEHLAQQLEHGSLVVTGTNGKTTTSSFIAAILRDSGLRVWRNREGSNLMRGVAGSLVIRALPNGRLRRAGRAVTVLEIDEAVLPQVVQLVTPRVAVFTNLFRDQLDRYGEVDSVINYWKRAVALLSSDTTLVLNADDPSVAYLGTTFAGRVLYYGIEDTSLDLMQQEETHHQVIDTHTCPRCGHEFIYAARFYSHMGHYTCPQCLYARPEVALQAVSVQTDTFDRLRVRIDDTTIHQQQELVIPLPGIYNVYNALAAATAARAIDIAWEPIVSGIEQSKPVFGRGERIQAEGRTIRLLLAKNPTSFNEVLRTLFSEGIPRHLLFVLNNNIADGQDISWIWDVDFERCVGHVQTLVVAGNRALDLALRLKYAGIAEEAITIVPPAPFKSGSGAHAKSLFGVKNALRVALEKVPLGETLFIVPTYTGLLEVHQALEQRGLTPHYWEGTDAE